jgi:tetratricopeptide (TPR) repeat protein
LAWPLGSLEFPKAPCERERVDRRLSAAENGRVTKRWITNHGRGLAGGALLLVLVVLAYWPALRAGFIWDDDDHFTENPAMVSSSGLKQIWSSLAVARYYPLTLTSFWVQRRLWGLAPLPYHAVNVVLHAVNSILLYRLLRRLRVPGAWPAAAIWALHPVNVESVAWVTELKNVQSGFFFFGAALCFLRFEDQRRWSWYAGALLSGAAAMLSKPSTVVLPAVLLLIGWWRRGRWTGDDVWRVVPFIALAAGMSLLTVIEQQGHISREGTAEWSLWLSERLVVAGRAVWFYAAKLVWPAKLMFVYPRWEPAADRLASWVALGCALAVGVVLWTRRRQAWARAGLLGAGSFVIALTPVLGLVDVYYFRYSFVADHFQYLASAGLIALAVGTGATLSRRGGRWARALGAVAATTVLLALGAATWRHTHIFRDDETLWRDTLAKNPTAWMAHNNLGVLLAKQGRTAGALAHYQAALRLRPAYAEGHNNLAEALDQQGRTAEAIAHYREALRLKPDYPVAHNNLGGALVEQGQLREAIAQYQEALRLRPDYAVARYNLGIAYAKSGNPAAAIEQYREALRLRPAFAEAHYNLAAALAAQGRDAEALLHYREALRHRPDYPEAHNNLGVILMTHGRHTEALAHYQEALRWRPDYPEARANLETVTALRANPVAP